MSFLKSFFSFLTILSLIQSPVSQAMAATELSYQTQELFKKIKPVRKGEMIAEFFFRIDSELPVEMRDAWKAPLTNRGNWVVPDIRIKDNTITLNDGRQKLVLVFEEKNGKRTVLANGQRLTEADAKTPQTLMAALDKAMRAKKVTKTSLLMDVLMPKAQAFEMSTMLIIGGLALGAYLLYQGFSKKDNKAAACTSTSECCQVGTTYQVGCCSQLSGTTILGYATCPVGQTPQGLTTGALGTLGLSSDAYTPTAVTPTGQK